jgi:hypothetical protein
VIVQLEKPGVPEAIAEETMLIGLICDFCNGTVAPFTIHTEDYEAWRQGALIQNAFPELPLEIREMMISGMCPKCWDKTFRR